MQEAVDAEQKAQGDEAEQDEAQGDEAEQKIQLEEKHEQVETTTIRWNFPIFGKIFLELLEGFVTQNPADVVEDVCMKEPSFAGFWSEAKIFKHFMGPSRFYVDYIPVNTETQKLRNIELSISSVVSLDSVHSSELEVGILYELRSCHPIVDSIL